MWKGLEVHAKDGQWLTMALESDTYIIMAGELLKVRV
jgi:isopenicillin N synthase-like dioxygenase